MATKRQVLMMATEGRGCLGKAADNEPVFVLRAQDRSAPTLIRLWASLATERGGCSELKIADAYKLADQMEAWPVRKYPD